MGPSWASLRPSRLPSRRVFCERMVNELLTLKHGHGRETLANPTGLKLFQRAKIELSGMITFCERLSGKNER